MTNILETLKLELDTIWQAHERVGLDGKMCLYTLPDADPVRAEEREIQLWFGKEDTDSVIEHIDAYYNDGEMPNSPLILNPIVHKRNEEGGEPIPVGSGIFWATCFCLGKDELKDESLERISALGAYAGTFERGDNPRAGLKIVGFADKMLPINEDGLVDGCFEGYELANIESDEYFGFYFLSGIKYLTSNGLYGHPHFDALEADPKKTVTKKQTTDAAACWEAYEKHHRLFEKFGFDAKNLDQNLRYFNLCARDFFLYDSTGEMRVGAKEEFEFIVPGWIPKGAVTLVAGSGGTGKSSLAHHLCTLAAIDYKKGEAVPTWLGSDINYDMVKDGICVYFSGEDGPAIINARGKLFDDKARANRLMFHRTDFGDGVSFADFLKRLEEMPSVPLMVIDPARKYLTGNEDDADVVSEFFEAIEEFAMNKQAAVLVVHHLSKGAYPKSCREVLDCLRGSQVFIDRPRVVIGMYREGPYTCVGLSKNNIPPNLGMVQGERVFARDPESLQLLWLPGDEGVKSDGLSAEEIEKLKKKS